MKNNPKENLDEWTKGLPDSSYTTTSESNIKFEENKSKITFSNESKKKCLKVDVDGGVYPKGGKKLRCDKFQDKFAFAVGRNNVPKISTQIQGWIKNFKRSGVTLKIEDTPAKYDL
ncbi:hypothetical protein [Fibrobacter sp.]|uniref:hypothetical protein n=1 Tax=Fibrobacter sp. TaxID=35828 RepID=UPI00388F0791